MRTLFSQQQWIDMKVLVTGATSGLGRNAVEFLCQKGISVRATGRNEAMGKLLEKMGAEFVPADLTELVSSQAKVMLAGRALGLRGGRIRISMKDVSLLDLLKSGAHFGHKTSRWNPKMKPYIFTVRNDIHILDLEKTKKGLLKAASFATDVASKGGTILFIATKRQSRDIVRAAAQACGMPYVNVRWLGGTFTNYRTIQKTIRKMEKLMEQQNGENYNQRYTKKERLLIDREVEKMNKLFAGIKDLRRMPEAVFIADINHDDIALKESIKMKIKIIGVVDSNSNPDVVDYAIPANDDATQAIELVSTVIAGAINEGKAASPATTAPVVAAATEPATAQA